MRPEFGRRRWRRGFMSSPSRIQTTAAAPRQVGLLSNLGDGCGSPRGTVGRWREVAVLHEQITDEPQSAACIHEELFGTVSSSLVRFGRDDACVLPRRRSPVRHTVRRGAARRDSAGAVASEVEAGSVLDSGRSHGVNLTLSQQDVGSTAQLDLSQILWFEEHSVALLHRPNVRDRLQRPRPTSVAFRPGPWRGSRCRHSTDVRLQTPSSCTSTRSCSS